jgi:hypothetical protein
MNENNKGRDIFIVLYHEDFLLNIKNITIIEMRGCGRELGGWMG